MPEDWLAGLRKPTPVAVAVPVANGAVVNGNGTGYALAALASECEVVANTVEGGRDDALNKAAFRMGRHVGAGNIDVETVVEALTYAGRRCGLLEHEIERALRLTGTGGLARGMAVPRHPDPRPELGVITARNVLDCAPTVPGTPGTVELGAELGAEAEERFWKSRPILEHIHTFARARMVAPWAVLGCVLARVITATPWTICLPPIIGGRAGLNLFVGLVGPSGSGKGAAEAVAAEAVLVGYVETHNTGSGEGIAHGYMRRVKGLLEWNDDRHAVLFSVPEIDSLAAQGDRKGATLMPQLRSGWTGEQLGFGYADPLKRITVPAHQYRLCLVAGIQPGRAGCLLDDADGGTPQRFLWLPATDPTVPDVEPDAPPPMTWEAPVLEVVGYGGNFIEVCELARRTIREARRARARGDGNALDGHALLAQLKTAAALGIADGRYSVTEEDWALAGVIAAKSAETRAAVVRFLAERVASANVGKALADADRAVVVTEKLADLAVKRVCGGLVRRLARDGDWVTRNDLRRAVASRDREHYDEALDRLANAGQIEADESNGAHGQGGKGSRYRLLNSVDNGTHVHRMPPKTEQE